MFEYFTEKAIAVIMAAQQEARRLGHNFVGTEQVLVGLLKEGTNLAAQVLTERDVTLETTQAEVEKLIGRGSGFVPTEVPFTPKTKQMFEQAFQEARQFDHHYIGPEHLLLSMIKETDSAATKVLIGMGVDLADVRTQLIRIVSEEAALPVGVMREQPTGDRRPQRKAKALDEFGTDMTLLAAEGKLDPVVGRDREIERVIQILGRRSKNNPVLIGEPGVGKTAIAEGLAQRIVNQDVPETLLDKRVISLDMGSLLAGTRFRGDFEERISQIISDVKNSQNVILVIDEIHTLVGAGSIEGGTDAANMLKPALARGELQCLGATTLDEYRQHIERDAALERRFQPVNVGEPTVEETIEILYGLRQRYEQHHRLLIADAALSAAATLADRYITDRFLPDKAIDLIDEAGSRVRFRASNQSADKAIRQELRRLSEEKNTAVKAQDFDRASQLRDREIVLEAKLQVKTTLSPLPEVTAEDIAQVLSAWVGVPVNQLTESESAMLLHLDQTLHQRVIGQDEAVQSAARALRRSRVGLGNPNRPIASLFFSGPTGVGKTELAKALAISVFGSEESMIRIDMSEFMESQTVSKLIGSPPGYVGYDEGGQLTEAVRRRPYSVILFDEIEKAHPDVFNLLLQLLEDGRLTDAKGRTVSFKNTLLIMTSNVGSRIIEKGGGGLGFDIAEGDLQNSQYQRVRSLVQDELKQFFRPEFLNRLDEIIVFRQLTRSEIEQIADLMIQEVAQRLNDQGIALEVTDAVKAKLVAEGHDPAYGARPLRRTITRLVEDVLAEAMLRGEIHLGDMVLLEVTSEGQVRATRQSTRQLQAVY